MLVTTYGYSTNFQYQVKIRQLYLVVGESASGWGKACPMTVPKRLIWIINVLIQLITQLEKIDWSTCVVFGPLMSPHSIPETGWSLHSRDGRRV